MRSYNHSSDFDETLASCFAHARENFWRVGGWSEARVNFLFSYRVFPRYFKYIVEIKTAHPIIVENEIVQPNLSHDMLKQ